LDEKLKKERKGSERKMATAAAALYYITSTLCSGLLGRVMVPGHEPMMYWALSNPLSSPEL
jgi:hypothetical protein